MVNASCTRQREHPRGTHQRGSLLPALTPARTYQHAAQCLAASPPFLGTVLLRVMQQPAPASGQAWPLWLPAPHSACGSTPQPLRQPQQQQQQQQAAQSPASPAPGSPSAATAWAMLTPTPPMVPPLPWLTRVCQSHPMGATLRH